MKVNNIEINEMPTVDYLNECFRCDEEEGKLYWRIRPDYHFDTPRGAINFNSRFANTEAKSSRGKDYAFVRLDGNYHRTHRLIWKMYYGEDPKHFIDHINGDKLDNRIENLRDVTQKDNNRNQHELKSNNTTGYRGVYYVKRDDNYSSYINYGDKKINLGKYKTAEEAALARELKAVELYGEEFYYANEKNKILLEELKLKVEEIKTTKPNFNGMPKIRSTVTNKLGYNGVEQVGNMFKSIVTKDKIKYPCGKFDTVEEAALAFEYKLIELYGREFYSYSDRDKILEDLEEKVRIIKESK